MKVLNLADKEVTKVIAKKQRAALKKKKGKKVKAPKIDEDTSLEALEKLLGATDKPKKKKKVNLRGPLKGRRRAGVRDLPEVNFRDCGTSQKVIEQAIEGVRLLEAKRHSDSEGKKSLLDDDEGETILYLQVGMMKVANTLLGARHVVRPCKLKVFLPNPVVNESTSVLLIAKDSEDSKDIRSDHSENLFHYQHVLRKSGAAKHISEVITLKQLKTEYKEYEAKRMLANRTDVVLCDSSIIFRIPLFLGKNFIAKRKSPLSINLQAKNLLREVERCLSCEILLLPMTGTSGIMKIGRLGQSNETIMENLKVALQVMKLKFPGGWGNIKTLNLKTEKSKSVPFYVNLNSQNTIRPIRPKPLSVQPHVTGELTTTGGHIYTVEPDNEVKLVRLGSKSEKAQEIKEKKEKRKREEEKKMKKRTKKRAKRKAATAAANGEEQQDEAADTSNAEECEQEEVADANDAEQCEQDENADANEAEQCEQDEDAVGDAVGEQQQVKADTNISKKSQKKNKKKQQSGTTNVENEAGSAKKKQKCDQEENKETSPEKMASKSKKKKTLKKKETLVDTTEFDLDYENLEEFDVEDFELDLEREKEKTPAKKKGSKSKKKNKKLEEECMDLDLDSDDDDQEINKLERDYLRKLNEESIKGKGKSKKKATFDEEDDWAEDSGDDEDGRGFHGFATSVGGYS